MIVIGIELYVIYKIWAADLYEDLNLIKISCEYFILIKKENHLLKSYLVKIFNNILRKFKLKLYANQDEFLADLKSWSWLWFSFVLPSLIIHDFLK